MNRSIAKEIDAILPQTQCGLCGFKGCMPYAEALEKGEASIDLCPPGGIQGLIAIAELVNVDPLPYLASMEQKAKPPMRVVIRESECIGCTKCIQACPVDAILGAGKLMHTVIADECTGCELCIAPCPVDCIDRVILDNKPEDKKSHFRKRYYDRENRLKNKNSEALKATKNNLLIDRQNYIQSALLRVQAKKNG